MTPALAEIPLVLAAAGAVVGSFTATAVIRNLRGQQASAGRSACDGCGAKLAYSQTVPLVSYVMHRGVCRTCASPIDVFHPWGEGAGALMGLSVGSAWVSGVAGPLQGLSLLVLGFALLALTLVDLRTQRLPDALTGIVLLACLVLAASVGLGGFWERLAWAAGCLGGLSLVRVVFARLKGEDGLGFGDVKLLSALAVWLGPLTPYALAAACLMALIARITSGRLAGRAPFGPWIALGAWTVGLAAEVLAWPA